MDHKLDISAVLAPLERTRAYREKEGESSYISSSLVETRGLRSQLWATQTERRGLKRALELLQEELMLSEIRENRVANALTPLGRLPTEVLRMIVLRGIPRPAILWGDAFESAVRFRRKVRYRRTIMSTCWMLRNLVLNDPEWWSFQYYPDDRFLAPVPDRIRQIDWQHMELSQTTELDVVIVDHPLHSASQASPSYENLQLLMSSHWHRCRSLSFTHKEDVYHAPFANLFDGVSFSSLRHLHLHYSYGPKSIPFPVLELLARLSSPSSLRSLLMQSDIGHQGETALLMENDTLLRSLGEHPVLGSLTALSLDYVGLLDLESVHNLLSHTPMLEHFRHSPIRQSLTTDFHPTAPLIMPCLLSITLSVASSPLFLGAAATKLEQIIIDDIGGHVSWIQGAPADAVQFPNLKRLHCSYEAGLENFLLFLRDHPKLEELSIGEPATEEDFLSVIDVLADVRRRKRLSARNHDSDGGSTDSNSDDADTLWVGPVFQEGEDSPLAPEEADTLMGCIKRAYEALPGLQMVFGWSTWRDDVPDIVERLKARDVLEDKHYTLLDGEYVCKDTWPDPFVYWDS